MSSRSTLDEGGSAPPTGVASLTLVLVCLAMGGISALETQLVASVHGTPVSWTYLLGSTTPRWILLAMVLPFVLQLATRVPITPLTARSLSLHLAVFVGVSVAHALVHTVALGVTSPLLVMVFSWSARMTRSWLSTMPSVAIMYGAILIAAWGMAEARERQRRTLRASQLEAQLQASQLAALRAQVHPHFLYNTLNGIAALVADVQPERAIAAIERLGELLHASLREDGRDAVSIEEECALIERYLALQQLRFGSRLSFEVVVAPSVAQCLVPVLLLQPLVENAVVHGLDAGRDVLRVSISAAESLRGVELRVENDGPDLGAGPRRNGRHGVGIASTRARLSTAYGPHATLALTQRPGGGVIVRIHVPRLLPGAESLELATAGRTRQAV